MSPLTLTPRVQKLRSLPSIRAQCSKVFQLAQEGKAEYFEYDEAKMEDVAQYCARIIERDYGTSYASIPPHGRWRHFDVNGIPRVSALLQLWSSHSPAVPPIEAARRLVDLFVVSVLLDAGAGSKWSYEEARTGLKISRSEGLAVASLDMFEAGMFAASEDESVRAEAGAGAGAADAEISDHFVQAEGLSRLSPDALAMAMQVHPDDNPMDGLEGRAALLTRLGAVLEKDEFGYFRGPKGQDIEPRLKRPGFIIDYLLEQPSTTVLPNGQTSVSLPALWEVIIQGLAEIWPASRTNLDGVALGDVWPCTVLEKSAPAGTPQEETMVPFHKLSQWLTYSILEPMEKILGWKFQDAEGMTGLPEYRNGGLFVDLGVLTPKPSLLAASLVPASVSASASADAPAPRPRLAPSHPAIIEWRALTVILLDRSASLIRARLGLRDEQLDLKQVLESATWKGGREIAREKRGASGGGPPIEIESDGTVF